MDIGSDDPWAQDAHIQNQHADIMQDILNPECARKFA
jgi:hypothetical protein